MTRSAGELFELEDQIAMYVRAIRRDGNLWCTGEDGKWSVAMCLAAQRSMETGSPVSMKEILQ